MPVTLSSPALNQLLTSQILPNQQHSGETSTYSSLLRALAVYGREKLGSALVEVSVPTGTVIFTEGDEPDGMYIVRAGHALIVKNLYGTQPAVLSQRGPGDVIGEMALIDNQPRSASFVATTPMRLLKLERDSFNHLLERDPAFSRQLLQVMNERVRYADHARVLSAAHQNHLNNQLEKLKRNYERLSETTRQRQETESFFMRDVRNPASNVLAGLDMLELTLPPAERQDNRDVLEMIRFSAERIHRLAETFLSVERIRAGQEPFARLKVNLAALLHSLTRKLPPTLQATHLTLELDLPGHLPPVAGDAAKLERVLTHLIDVAIRHTPTRSVLTLSAQVAGDMVQVRLRVPGMQFDSARTGLPFEQQLAQARHFDVVLLYCRLAVQVQGGRMWAEAAPEPAHSHLCLALPIATSSTGELMIE